MPCRRCRSSFPATPGQGRQIRACCFFSNLISYFPPRSSPTMLSFVPFPRAMFSHIVVTSHMPLLSGTQSLCPSGLSPGGLAPSEPFRASPWASRLLLAGSTRDPQLHGPARGGGAVLGARGWMLVVSWPRGDLGPGITPPPGGTTLSVCFSPGSPDPEAWVDALSGAGA